MKKLIVITTIILAGIGSSFAQESNPVYFQGCRTSSTPPEVNKWLSIECICCTVDNPDNGLEGHCCNGDAISSCTSCYGYALVDVCQLPAIFTNTDITRLDPDLDYWVVYQPNYIADDGTTGTLYVLTSDVQVEDSDDGTSGSKLGCEIIDFIFKN